MYRAILVDNEKIVLDAFQKVVDMKKYGFEVVGVYLNPLEALSEITSVRPHLIITDIKMPQMSGLDFSSQAKSLLPDVQIIVISSYDEFEFARTAMRIGIGDYLLKPIKLNELDSTIQKVKLRLDNEEAAHKERQHLDSTIKSSIQIMKNGFFLELLSGNYDETYCESQYNILGLAFKSSTYILIKITSPRYHHEADALNSFREIVVRRLAAYGSLETFRSGKALYCLFYDMKISTDQEQEILEELTTYKSSNILMALSQPHFGFGELMLADIECDYIILPQLSSDNTTQRLPENNEFKIFPDIKTLGAKLEQLTVELAIADQQGAFRTINEFFPADLPNSTGVPDYFYSIAVIIILKLLANQKPSSDVINIEESQISYLKKNFASLETLKAFLLHKTKLIVESLQGSSLRQSQRIVEKAKEYMMEHYSKNISLSDIADHIYVSKNYLSNIFKKETGVTVVDYLIEIRIKKAKDLLRDTRYKMYQISEMVGYNDYAYFSQLFKKQTGLTLSDYRKSL